MAVESARDRSLFLADFGTPATYTHAATISTVTGIHDRPAITDGLAESSDIITAQAAFVCRSADLPSGATEGDALAVDGIAYTVRAILADGTGMTQLMLQRA